MESFSRILKLTYKILFSTLVITTVLGYSSFTCLNALAQDVPNMRCNDVIYVNAKEIKDYLAFPGSPFKPTVKVTITYRPVEGSSLGEERLYEDLWYQGQNALGCRRYRDFDLRPKDLIYLYANSSSTAEHAATANAIVRILLDAHLNRNAIIGVAVASPSYWPLVDQFENENFYRPGKLSARPATYISLPLKSDDGRKTTLVYSEPI